ncbi:MAG: ATP-grasp domain-containing protein [Acidobacteriota bacterium]|nr:MAG: ATP-grasp domain-containing protein [Acidobacteriota bacterium]
MAAAEKRPVLLLGANDRAMFTFARQLKRLGFRVEVADGSPSKVQRSRFVDKFHRLTDPRISASGTANDLLSLIDRVPFEFIVPINDEALELCIANRDPISERTLILGLPTDEVYELSHDKSALLERCVELGIPVPRSVTIRSLEDLGGDIDALGYPMIVKPAFSKLIRGDRMLAFTVRTVRDRMSAIDKVRELVATCPVILQERLGGHGAGYNFLASDGEVLLEYGHERVTEPIEGGQSSYRRTIPVDRYGLSDHSRKLLRETRWTGIGMIEFRIEGSEAYVMEINGRPWGSIELGVFAGVNIPEAMVRFFYGHENPEKGIVAKSVAARNFKLDLRYAAKRTISARSPVPILKWLWDLRRTFSSSETVEDNPLRDPFYGIREYAELVADAGRKVMRKKTVELADNSDDRSPKPGDRIGFLCYGNICRSPFAEHLAASRYRDFEFRSYGSYPIPDRMVPTLAEKVGKERFGISLTDHRSRLLTQEDVSECDLVYAMDRSNVREFVTDFPEARGKIRLLAGSEIEDPYGKGEDAFQAVFEEIAGALDTIFGGHSGNQP